MFSKKNIRAEIKDQIVKQLYFFSGLSYNDLSLRLKETPSLITTILSELVREGLVVPQGFAPSSGGRKSPAYSLKADAFYILTVAMDQVSMRFCLTDLAGQAFTAIGKHDLRSHTPEVLRGLTECLDDHIRCSGLEKKKILGIGIGIPAFITKNKRNNYSFFNIGGEHLAAHLSKQLQIRTYIDNDSNLIALAEQWTRSPHCRHNTLVVNLGWSIGLGIIADGKLLRGNQGFAGQFGHIQLSADGLLCSCGKRGCLESEASIFAMAQKAIKGIKGGRVSKLQSVNTADQEAMGKALLNAALTGDQFAVELLSEAGYHIGKVLASVIHVLNPGTIILAGRGIKVAAILLAPIQQAITRYCIPELATGTELLISDLGIDAQLTGAAVLVMENYKSKRA